MNDPSAAPVESAPGGVSTGDQLAPGLSRGASPVDQPLAEPARTLADTLEPVATADEVVAALRRMNNLAIFLVFLVGLGALATAQTLRPRPRPAGSAAMLTWLRIAALAGALAITALHTALATRAASRRGSQPCGVEAAAPVFRRTKRVSIVLLAGVGVLAGACLAVSHRVLDLLLALLPIALLIAGQPSAAGLAAFAELLRPADGTRVPAADDPKGA